MTERNKILRDIAVEILFGGNPCVDLTEEIFSGIDRHVEAAEFGSIANVEAPVMPVDACTLKQMVFN